VSKGKEYVRLWIYVPSKVSEDTAFPFRIGDPCEVEIDTKARGLSVRSIPVDEAEKRGWVKRNRQKAVT
jgi:hypothetical protein